jgi:hypothetical protein
VKRLRLLALVALAGCGGSEAAPADRAAAPDRAAAADCHPARVHYTPYPGAGGQVGGPAWIEGEPRSTGLTAVLAYWPERWRGIRRAQVFTGGIAPEGHSAKTMWAFLAPSARGKAGAELVIEARNLEGPGMWRDTFAEIWYEGQNGAPSYASTLDLPHPGCWRLTLTTGDLKATVDLRAVRLERPPR